jgi:hypothetical protein
MGVGEHPLQQLIGFLQAFLHLLLPGHVRDHPEENGGSIELER